jgi:membrane-bound metal-dependent hydrolase YbcI (DUF457 family)
MKGISHFVVGVAVASVFPEAVRAGAAGLPLHFILGGMAGLLPDTLDFKIGRFFYRHDLQVAPDPLNPDADLIADAVAQAFNRAVAGNRPVRIKLNTIRIGADAWQSYRVRFDVSARRVVVDFGPVVNTGGQPIDGVPVPCVKQGEAALAGDVKLEYQATTTIDIFDGPVFELRPVSKGLVSPVFIPWHRQWSHAFPLAVAFGLAAAAIWGVTAGLVVAGGYSAHVVLDQFGYMGSNFFYPFTSRRSTGFRWMHAGDVLGNLAAVWLSCLVIFWNLQSGMQRDMPGLNFLNLFFYGALIPLLAFYGLRKALAWKR